MKNSPTGRGSQSGVSMVTDLWWTGFTKKVSFEFRMKWWWMEKVKKRRIGWGKHEEVKLVHEVKQEAYSRDEARHTENSDLWSLEKMRASVTSEGRVLLSVWRDTRFCRWVGWLVVRTL